MMGMKDEDLFTFFNAITNDSVLGLEEAQLYAQDSVLQEVGLFCENKKIKGCLIFGTRGAYFYSEPKNVHYDWQRQLLKLKKLKDKVYSGDSKKNELKILFKSHSGTNMEINLELEKDPSQFCEALASY